MPKKAKELSRALFIESLVGNIKEKYFFEKKIGSGGYGAVYLAKNKQSGRCDKTKINGRAELYSFLGLVSHQLPLLIDIFISCR